MTAKPWPKPHPDDCPRDTAATADAAKPPEVFDNSVSWSQRGSSSIDVTPNPGVLPGQTFKSWANWRAFIHQITPVVVTTLVGVGIVTDNQAALWVPLFFAIIDPLLNVGNAQDKLRRIVYGVAGLLQVGGLAGGLATGLSSGGNGLIAAGVGAGVTILSTFLSRFYTPTTTMQAIPNA